MPIEFEGLSGRRHPSRLGKIRLGEKAVNAKGKEYPVALDHFRFDPDDPAILPMLEELFGPAPKSLRVFLPADDPETVFPQYLKRYGKSGLLCKGTGRIDPDTGEPGKCIVSINADGESDEDATCDPRTCPYFTAAQPQCKRLASLLVILRDFPTLRAWQIDTTSANSIIAINTAIEELANLEVGGSVRGDLRHLPLVLSLVPREVKRPEWKAKRTIYILQLDLDTAGLVEMQRARSAGRALPVAAEAPELEGPIVADEAAIPDGMFARSVVEGADLDAERREAAAASGNLSDAGGDGGEKDVLDEVLERLKTESPAVTAQARRLGLTVREMRQIAAQIVDLAPDMREIAFLRRLVEIQQERHGRRPEAAAGSPEPADDDASALI